MQSTLLLFILSFIGYGSSHPSPVNDLSVKTNSGILGGFTNSKNPNVRQFLGIPFAHPPIGPRRWLPPWLLKSNSFINATSIGPACPQIARGGPTDFTVYSPHGGNQTEIFPSEPFSEDCLTLNVWTPRTNEIDLPVLRSQSHIVVSVNFRSNIFGFPNAAGLKDQNLGLLDQRLSLEWVRSNIASFGGSPNRTIAWGQSGGAGAIDYLNFAYPNDPIFTGMILQSSTALYPQGAARTFDTSQANFSAIATLLNCTTPSTRLSCLRAVPWRAIESARATLSSTTFLPIPDNTLVFQNYKARYSANALSTVPAIIGTTAHEFNDGIPTPLSPNFNQSTADLASDSVFLCTAALSSRLRTASNQTTYRYRYDGSFGDISSPAYPGAWHASELPLLFGTMGMLHGEASAYEGEVSRAMQDLWLAFARDPVDGLREVGWGTFEEGRGVVLGGVYGVGVRGVDVGVIDGVCEGVPALE